MGYGSPLAAAVIGRGVERTKDPGPRSQALGLLIALAFTACVDADIESVRRSDLTEAASFVESNIASIQRRDTEWYLDHYLESPELTIAAADSIRRGFLLFAEARRASDLWPDTLITDQPTLVWLAPGAVWVGFRFLAVLEGDTTRGVSERVLVKTPAGWKITVTGSMEQ